MGWATRHIADLRAGKVVQFRPHGNSMTGKVNDGQLVTVEPLCCRFYGCETPPTCSLELPDSPDNPRWVWTGHACEEHALKRAKQERVVSLLNVGDIVLCKVNGREYLHLVKAVKGGSYLIGNNKGKTNGWTKAVYGRCIRVEA